MKTKHFLTLGAAMMAFVISGTSLSLAQEDYKPNRRNNEPSRQQLDEMDYSGMLSQSNIRYGFVNNMSGDPDKIMIRIISPNVIQGCASIYPIEATPSIIGKTQIIDIKFPHIIPNYKERNIYKCNQQNMVGTDVALSHSELLEKGINMLQLRSKFGSIPYNLEVTENRIKMTSHDKKLRPLEYWIMPQNTVILTVPKYDGDLIEDNEQLQMLARIARARGLKPIEDVAEGFVPHTLNKDHFYFVDTEGRLSEMLNNESGTAVIGELYTFEQFYGPDGKYDKEIALDILAMKPGEYN